MVNIDIYLPTVVGDPFGATTHTDLVLRAKEAGIQYRVIHNASIMNAIGCCGLQVVLTNEGSLLYQIKSNYVLFSYIALEKQYQFHFGLKRGNLTAFVRKSKAI